MYIIAYMRLQQSYQAIQLDASQFSTCTRCHDVATATQALCNRLQVINYHGKSKCKSHRKVMAVTKLQAHNANIHKEIYKDICFAIA